MRAQRSSSAAGAVIVLLAAAALISNVNGVWTCPSEREPFCCGKYSRVNESSTVLIGKPESPKDPRSSPNSTSDYYCDSRAVGYGLHRQE
ncbi:hypothetical protein ACJ72_02185 [Emergomyces africanus]|uniref:Uncharacterized protein n=1 Tax=Emergomyces africanus TaxID=1955775 RepID=A0A1B7P331_9EURO|nr:hypothetical protein ACJ72_02185 [Emergomyces africanus]